MYKIRRLSNDSGGPREWRTMLVTDSEQEVTDWLSMPPTLADYGLATHVVMPDGEIVNWSDWLLVYAPGPFLDPF